MLVTDDHVCCWYCLAISLDGARVPHIACSFHTAHPWHCCGCPSLPGIAAAAAAHPCRVLLQGDKWLLQLASDPAQLKGLSNLTSLNLSNNQISDEGALLLATMLRSAGQG